MRGRKRQVKKQVKGTRRRRPRIMSFNTFEGRRVKRALEEMIRTTHRPGLFTDDPSRVSLPALEMDNERARARAQAALTHHYGGMVNAR